MWGIPQLDNVVIEDGVTSIGENAFRVCHTTSITIPASVTSIGKNAISANTDGTLDIYYGGSKADWEAVDMAEYDIRLADLTIIHCSDGDITIEGEYYINYCNATLSWTKTTYNGNAKRPKVTVKTKKGTTLKKGKNYTVEYTNNVEAGIATVTIKGIGKYIGTITRTFTIRPVKPTGVRATANEDGSITVYFDRHDSADKYYIYIDGEYKGCAKTDSSYTVSKKLKSGTTYEVSVKAVKDVKNGRQSKIYSLMSSSVSVTTK